MTRFDEALQEYARAAEPGMRERVASAGNRFATVQEVGRGRTRRAALQAVASLAIVAVVGGAAWVAADRLHTMDPAQRVVDSIQVLGAEPFVCGAPFPYEPGVTVTREHPQLPEVVQHFSGPNDESLDLAPGATTLPTENGLSVNSTASWEGAPPQFWGVNTFGVLLDRNGKVAARTALESPETTSGSVARGLFLTTSCTDPALLVDGTVGDPNPLNGTYTIHVVSQLWDGNPGSVVAMWVDQGLVPNASITFDYALYQAQQDELAEHADAMAKQAQAAIVASGGTLATVGGPAVLPSTSACALKETVEAGGLAAQPAASAGFAKVDAELKGRDLTWHSEVGADTPWWADGGDFAVFFLNADGTIASVGAGRLTGSSGGPDGITSRAVVEPYEGCGITGVPTASGTYRTFVFVPYPGTFGLVPPAGLDQDSINYVAGWAPLGTYTVP